MKQEEFNFDAKPRSEASAAIIDRIKKLLRLGADMRGNRHEAERAMALAFELAEKYRVDVGGLDLDEESERLVHEYVATGLRIDHMRSGVWSLLQTYFHVTICHCPPRMLVIGKPHDVAIAHYVHDFLLRTGRECLARYAKVEKSQRRRMTTLKRSGYINGFIWGVGKTLEGARQSFSLTDAQRALVVAEDLDRQKRLDEMVPNRKNRPSFQDKKTNQSALEAGWADGRKTQIHQPLSGTPGATLLLQ